MTCSFERLNSFINEHREKQYFLLTDSNAAPLILPVLYSKIPQSRNFEVITIPAGDENKNLETAQFVWKTLVECGASRSSVMINIGGGMTTDLGGFVAATFKRGMRCINIPTTLLAMVDASAGGKTGINFMNLKNEIGVFSLPEMVIVDPVFLTTLPHPEILSGYAEMLKTGLIADANLYSELLNIDISAGYSAEMNSPINRCIEIKDEIVTEDPEEKNLRKVLNYGHTAGHAFESLAMIRKHPVAHGIAIAWGLVAESVLSHLTTGFDSANLYPLASFVKQYYPAFPFRCTDYDELIALMAHDKKNSQKGEVNFTLLQSIGYPSINNIVGNAEIKNALDITQDLLL